MKTDVADYIGDSSTSFLTKIGKFLNARYRDIMGRYDWKALYDTFTITTVSGQQAYPLPNDYADIVYVFDNTNKKPLYYKAEGPWLSDPTLIGSSDYFTISESTVGVQPTSSSVITFVSDSASDNTQYIFVKGISGGFIKSETVTLGGTTPVSTTNSYTKLVQISKSGTTSGGITVTDEWTNTLTYLNPTQLQTRDRMIHLFYTPNATASIIVRYKRDILPLINDYDYPITDCADEMIIGATADAWRAKRQYAKAADLEGKYEQQLNLSMFQEEQNKDISIDPIPYPRTPNINSTTTYGIA